MFADFFGDFYVETDKIAVFVARNERGVIITTDYEIRHIAAVVGFAFIFRTGRNRNRRRYKGDERSDFS